MVVKHSLTLREKHTFGVFENRRWGYLGEIAWDSHSSPKLYGWPNQRRDWLDM